MTGRKRSSVTVLPRPPPGVYGVGSRLMSMSGADNRARRQAERALECTGHSDAAAQAATSAPYERRLTRVLSSHVRAQEVRARRIQLGVGRAERQLRLLTGELQKVSAPRPPNN
jgi:hypothetical protein